jgi:hypothetical protein
MSQHRIANSIAPGSPAWVGMATAFSTPFGSVCIHAAPKAIEHIAKLLEVQIDPNLVGNIVLVRTEDIVLTDALQQELPLEDEDPDAL